MPTKTPSRFHLTLKDPDSEQRRFVTLSRVPCPVCKNDPLARGGFLVGEHRIPTCRGCDGKGDVPATAESAAAFMEEQEAERVAFRLDEAATLGKYAMTMPTDALDVVNETVVHFPKDTHTVNGFYRKGKVMRAAGGDPSVAYEKAHRGWLQFHLQEKPYKVHRVGRDEEKMAVTGGMYGVPIKNLMVATTNGTWDWDADTIKFAMTTSSYTVDIDTHDFFNDVTNEITGTNYTANGYTLASTASSYDTATDQARLDAADVSQATATYTARRAVIFKSTGTASTSPLISFLDFGADVSPSAGTFSCVFDATGIVIIDVT